MENLMIKGIADCFSNKNTPILIFCNWEDALKIRDDAVGKTEISASFENTQSNYLNCVSLMYEGKEFYFVDEMQKNDFFKILNQNKTG
ncbi:MAG: hypothetical protein H7Y10_03710 [Flavobacterium sp.]|nr:hypothetical protein [Flavobacterium sp.]